MNNIEKRSTKNNKKYLLGLLLLFLLIVFGIWKCPRTSEKKSSQEIVQEKVDSLDAKPEVVNTESTPPTINNEIKTATKERPATASESNKDNSSKSSTKKTDANTVEIKNETPPENEPSSEEIIPTQPTLQKAPLVYKVNKTIDKRPAASSGTSCKATTILKIPKASIQTSLSFSPEGAKFAVGNHNNYITVLNMEGEELLKLIGHKHYVQSVKYSPDGKFLATASMDSTAKLWDASTGKEIMKFEGHTEGILNLAYSPNGKYIATGSLDHTTILWDAKSGDKLFQLSGHKSEVAEVTFSNDSNILMTGSSDGTAKAWDVKSGKILYALEGHEGVVGGVVFTPDDKVIATASTNKIRLWNAIAGKHIHTINGNKESIMSIFISPDGQFISSSSTNGLIKIWQIKGGKEVCQLEGHSTRTREAVFHPTKKNTIVSASNDKTIRIWEFEPE